MTALKSLGYQFTNGKTFSLSDRTIRTANVKPDQVQGGGVMIVEPKPAGPEKHGINGLKAYSLKLSLLCKREDKLKYQ